MNILPPADILDKEPEKLYTIGFDDKEPNTAPQSKADVLQRKELGEKLSRIAESSNEALIIALNGGWGSGKTWFLKRWVGAHGLENNGQALTVYISAFNHDYLEDPLPSIILAIDERLNSKEDFTQVKEAAAKAILYGRAAAYSTLNAVSHNWLADFLNFLKEEKKPEVSYWQDEKGKRESLNEFRNRLAEFAETQPLVIVIDELDRAKPDYALSVLEVIKHFFNVPHVKFILGVNLPALGKMVEHRYGLEPADAIKYLERFIHFTLELPNKTQTDQGAESNAAAYCAWALKNMAIGDKPTALFSDHIEAISQNNPVSLRDAQRLLSKFVLILSATSEQKDSTKFPIAIEILLCLLSSRLLQPQLYKKLVKNITDRNDILSYYGHNSFNDPYHKLEELYDRWRNAQQDAVMIPSDYDDTPKTALMFLQYYLEGRFRDYAPSLQPGDSICAAFMWIQDIPKLHAEVPHYDELTYLDRAQSYLDLFNLTLPTEAEVAPAPTADKKADEADTAPDN